MLRTANNVHVVTGRDKNSIPAKPILKWAGGKSQLLKQLISRMPISYGQYIEPFLGGGALFFALQPRNAVIADSNPELINVYQQVATCTRDVVRYLKMYDNSKETFYSTRSENWCLLPKAQAAARTIFLNRTCFNGLYRVNKKGEFNVPFGNYSNPKICDENALYRASEVLKKAKLLCQDYKDVLRDHARPGDFIFLDPPYLPISQSSDFKRYTKEQFHEKDHLELAKIVLSLHEKGCHILLTNSNHPLVHEAYASFQIETLQTKRHISCRTAERRGEDTLITIVPKKRI